ncbi:MAG: ABC transporter permease [Candidatus Thermoplasmatota archaeon]|nr:ABC transporter permease [Candidatus Thermoplasmatota archaeon]
MKFVSIAVKGIKEIFRDKKGLTLLIVFPMAFMFVFGFAFGSTNSANEPMDIVVLNYDTGTILYYENISEEINFGDNFTSLLKDLKYEDNVTHLFTVHNVSEEKANDMLIKREIACILIIPENFSNAIRAMINETVRTEITSNIGEMLIGMNVTEWNTTNGTADYPANHTLPEVENVTAELIIKGDTGYIEFGIAQSMLIKVFEGYKNEIKRNAAENVSLYFGSEKEYYDFVQSEIKPMPGTESFTIFDYQAPGIIVFALLMMVPAVAGSLARESEKGTLERLKLSKMKSFDLLFGTLIPWSLVASVQVIILFLVALLMGFHWQGGNFSLILAIGIGIIGGVASISLGLLVAAFVKSEKHATTLSPIIAVPMSFLVGAFFPLPKAVIGHINGKGFQIYDVLPWTHTVNALRYLLTFGNYNVSYYIVMMSILTAILFIAGIVCFSKNRLKAE